MEWNGGAKTPHQGGGKKDKTKQGVVSFPMVDYLFKSKFSEIIFLENRLNLIESLFDLFHIACV